MADDQSTPNEQTENIEHIEWWFGEIVPENDLQRTVMLLFSKVFEEYIACENDTVDTDKVPGALLETLDNSVNIFTSAVLSNKELIEHIYMQLVGMKRYVFPRCEVKILAWYGY